MSSKPKEEEEEGVPVQTHCNTLQHTATHCNTLQHTATHCKTLQHTTTQLWGIPVPGTGVFPELTRTCQKKMENAKDVKNVTVEKEVSLSESQPLQVVQLLE